MELMVTGGAGFIGSNFMRYVLAQHPTDLVLNLDKLTYSGNLQTLRDVEEVYASASSGEKSTEESPLAPNSPCAASKASADLPAQAHFRTFRFPVIITRCSNNYGPYRYPEKFIPLMRIRAAEGQSIPVYGDGMQVRDWIWVNDHCTWRRGVTVRTTASTMIAARRRWQKFSTRGERISARSRCRCTREAGVGAAPTPPGGTPRSRSRSKGF